mmetsp:Transcript_9726/g.14495  ORF Transcript_9726/g.14495 Transcript_9726/m.14495 type:complete len:324 (-) Transcript_9726:59-1030(-)
MWWFLLFLGTWAEAKKCRALSLSGGGSHGAYEAGVFKALVENLSSEEVEYNVVVGISAGSLNAVGIAQWAMGEESQASQFLQDLWEGLDGYHSVFQNWNLGIVSGLLSHSGLFDTEPLRQTLKNALREKVARNITLGATNINDGSYGVFTEALGNSGIVEAGMCSSAIPAVFPIQNFQGALWIDGGVTDNNDIASAVERCLEVTGNEADIVVDMINCGSSTLAPPSGSLNTIDILLRQYQLNSYDKGMRYLSQAVNAFPDVTFRYYAQPSESLPGIIPLDFKQEDLEESISIGVKDGKYLINNNIYAKQILENHQKSTWIEYP